MTTNKLQGSDSGETVRCKREEEDMKNARVSVTCMVSLLVLLSGCASSLPQPAIPPAPAVPPTTTTPPPANHLIATPAQLVIRHGESWSFALWKGSSNIYTQSSTLVESTWSVQEGAVGGSVTGDGVYTAPAGNGTYHVIGASKSDPANTVTVTVIVGDGLALSGDPSVGYGFGGYYTVLLPDGRVMIEVGVEYTSKGKSIGRIDQYDPATGTFAYWNTVERVNFSATLLANGDVLLAGGDSETTDANGKRTGALLADVQILRTGSGLIEKTGALNQARNGHTATLLQDGRVLIAGGTKTAELYDPVTGVFTETGSMSVEHFFGRAILLRNGKVLITGAAPFELFDPVTNTFSGVDTLPNDVAGGTAVLLKDGRVLISGGLAADGRLTHEAYFYDPVTAQFTLAGKLLTAREGHSATLLADGTILIAGGIDTPPDDYTDGNWTNTTEIFDPATDTFTAGTPLKTAGRHFSATLLLDGSVLFIGGNPPKTEIWKP
jgi:hypothetical protein